VPLRDSTVIAIAAELKIKKDDDKPITDRDWRKLICNVIAGIAKNAVKNRL
jgi:hypothetical protein